MALPLVMAGAALGMGVISGVGGIFGANKAAKLQRMRTREEIRRMTHEYDKTYSLSTALGGEASGITGDSKSLSLYLNDMTNEFKRQSDFVRKAGKANESAMKSQAMFNAIGSIGGSLFAFGATNNWFKQAPLSHADL